MVHCLIHTAIGAHYRYIHLAGGDAVKYSAPRRALAPTHSPEDFIINPTLARHPITPRQRSIPNLFVSPSAKCVNEREQQ